MSSMTWQETLDSLTRPNSPAYIEAEIWKRDGWTLERVIAEWPVGADILWIAEIMGVITKEQASRVACACVDAVADLAPDVDAVVGAVWDGNMVAAWHETEATDAIIDNKVIEDNTPIDPPDSTIWITPDITPGASKARFAASRLLSGDNPNVLYHVAQARVHDARDAWAQALREIALANGIEPDENGVLWFNDEQLSPVSLAELKELEAAIKRVEEYANLAQADFVRWLLGGIS